MSTSLPSLMSRKKKVPGTRAFDATKVFSDYSPQKVSHISSYQDNFHHYGKKNSVRAAGKSSRSQTGNVSFLLENPRFINEPICFAHTKSMSQHQTNWWPELPTIHQKPTSIYKNDSVSRHDYKWMGNATRLTRFGCTPNRHVTAQGVIPTIDPNTMIACEQVSYEHQFDCRQGRKIRGKLKGSFVWEPIRNLRDQEKIMTQLKGVD